MIDRVRFHSVRSLPLLLLLALVAAPPVGAQVEEFFPDGQQFDTEIPSPEEYLGYELGTHHTRHDRIVDYFQELAGLSDRATYQVIGWSVELRPIPVLTVTDPQNHARLEEIREAHLEWTDPAANPGPVDDRPVIVHLGYGVHGNETSSSETAMLQAYWLVASETEDAERARREGVFHIEPVLNPDGRDRHTNWANMHKGSPPVEDPLDREHNEVWPGGRTNHYWFDLNRDWLPLEQPESRSRIDFHHRWRPNVVTDYHEMGRQSTYFFEPTEPELSWNPLLPERLYREFTLDFAEYFAEALDEIGSFYFTQEDRFDNTYPGYGSTYPNFLGGLGLVFEQASARGIAQEGPRHGVLSFAFAIRNHLRTSLATVRAAVENRERLLEYQREFFTSGLEEASELPVSAYVFGDPHDASRNRLFVDLLLHHRLEVYELDEAVEVGGHTFEPGSAWVVPTDQPKVRMVRSIFERTEEYTGRAGGRASAWTMTLAYDMPDGEIRDGTVPAGPRVTAPPAPEGLGRVARSSYAYLLDWSETFAPKALYHLLSNGVRVEAAHQPFTARTDQGEHAFPRGSVSVPVQGQELGPDALHELVLETEERTGVAFRSVQTGITPEGIDLGSDSFRPVTPPRALMIVGDGVSSGEAGEVWHLLDTRVDMPITKVDRSDLDRVRFGDYTVVVLVSGSQAALEGERLEDLRRWLQSGGTLVAQRTAALWAAENGLAPRVAADDGRDGEGVTDGQRLDYGEAAARATREQIMGVIAEVDVDPTHPVGFGLHRRSLPVWRDHGGTLPPSRNPYSTVARYTEEPRLSGFLTERNANRLAGTSSVLADGFGSGSVILFLDNPNFRGFWYGTNRLFLNALFFGEHVDVPAAP